MKRIVRGALCGTFAAALVVSGGVSQALCQQQAEATTLSAGQWQTRPSILTRSLGACIDRALRAQSPNLRVSVSRNKRTRTVTVSVSCRARKAGIQKAKNRRAGFYASLSTKVYVSNLYRSTKSESCVSCNKTVHGLNAYGKDRSSDLSLRVGRKGTAQVYLRYEGLLGFYCKGVLSKRNHKREIYWNKTSRIKVASVNVPKGYRLRLKLTVR